MHQLHHRTRWWISIKKRWTDEQMNRKQKITVKMNRNEEKWVKMNRNEEKWVKMNRNDEKWRIFVKRTVKCSSVHCPLFFIPFYYLVWCGDLVQVWKKGKNKQKLGIYGHFYVKIEWNHKKWLHHVCTGSKNKFGWVDD